MERDIGKIKKNEETDIVIRIDDFGGKTGLTIREFVHSPGYTGFTKAGVRIRAEEFENFKQMVNSISEKDLKDSPQKSLPSRNSDDENSGIDEDGLM